MAVGLSAKSFGIRLNALMMVGLHTYLGSDCGSNPALWMIPNFVHCMNCLPRELHCVQQTSVQRLDFCIYYCYMACPFLFYMILEVVPSLMEILFFSPNLVWLSPQCRYCQRAKALFKELNEQPYIVEIDLRGNIRIKSLSLSFSLSYLAFELWTQFFGYGVSHCCSLYDGDSAKSSLHK